MSKLRKNVENLGRANAHQEKLNKAGLNDGWKTVDLSKVFAMDLTAAISLLTMIRDTPEVYDGCLRVIENYRKVMIERERNQVELDKLELERKLQDSKSID